MKTPTTRILLIQDNSDYAVSVRAHLSKDKEMAFDVHAAASLKAALESLAVKPADIILLELSLPDSQGLETFEKIQAAAPQAPIVILTFLDEELTALHAVQKGAQDYLLKTQDESKLLLRIIRCAIERQRVKQELLQLSFTDELTGLHNRRGFSVLMEQQMKFARRSKKGFLLIMMDMDDFKQINDVHGHIQGDNAITQAADILRKTFRQSDVIARIGGDEFAVLALEAGIETVPVICQRLSGFLEQHNLCKTSPYQLAMSTGAAYFDPLESVSFEQLFEKADNMLYQHKRHKPFNRRVSKEVSS
jgi:two-component system cell cycle response regulator